MSTTTSATQKLTDEVVIRTLRTVLKSAEVQVRTVRGLCGVDGADPGMSDFHAALVAHLSLDDDDFHALREAAEASPGGQSVFTALAGINPLLADVTFAIKLADGGVDVTLVELEGSILDGYRLVGDLYDALDARSTAHEALYGAFEWDEYLDVPRVAQSCGLNTVGALVTLLTGASSSSRLNEVAEGLGIALVSRVLQDVADRTDAVLTFVGKRNTPERQALADSLTALSFARWKKGIWIADTGTRVFGAPAVSLSELLS